MSWNTRWIEIIIPKNGLVRIAHTSRVDSLNAYKGNYMKICPVCGEKLKKTEECKYVEQLREEIKNNPNPKRLPYKDVPINNEADRTKDLYEEITGDHPDPMPGIDKWFSM